MQVLKMFEKKQQKDSLHNKVYYDGLNVKLTFILYALQIMKSLYKLEFSSSSKEVAGFQ